MYKVRVSSIGIAIVFISIGMAATLLGCGLFNDGLEPVQSEEGGQVSQFGSAASVVGYDGPDSLEERIFDSPVIARVRLDSVSSTVESGPAPDGTTKYIPLLEFRFRVLEYLKGSGANDIVAVWDADPVFDTRQEAEAALPAIVVARDTQWDDREAIIFLKRSITYLASTQRAGRFYLSGMHYAGNTPDDSYSLASRFWKLWLPAEAVGGTQSQTAGDQRRFLMDVPPASGTAPTITLGEMKNRIAAVAAKLNAGDGSLEYTECVRRTYWRERLRSHREETYPDRVVPYGYPPQDHVIDSGLAAASTLYEDDKGYGLAPDYRNQFWLDGGDADLFSVEYGEAVPYDSTGDGVNDAINFSRRVVTSRPIPVGEYRFHSNERGTFFIPCEGFAIRYEWTVTVSAPEGTRHELFFDPVTDGTTVTADAANGVLKPASFTAANSASAMIEGISYESGTVEIEVTPDDALSGHILDIIELDGTVSLSLDAFDATVDAANDTLSWSVSEQPWEDGDLLMVRIREAPPSCRTSGAVSNSRTEPDLVADCEALLELRDALAGTGSLNWSVGRAMTDWDGVTVGGTPKRVTELDLNQGGLTGVVPSGLSDLTGLERLVLSLNTLTGEIPSELGDLSNLEYLDLSFNYLSGAIPSELGNLSELRELWLFTTRNLSGPIPSELGNLSNLERLLLSGNELTGEIPVELGGLSELMQLWLHDNELSGVIPTEFGELKDLERLKLDDNDLSGPIPWELGELSELEILHLSGNDFEGCIRPSLRTIAVNDLGRLGLSDCEEEGRVPAPGGLSATQSEGVFTITWNEVTGASKYETHHRVGGSDEEWASLNETEGTSATYGPIDGASCGTTYEFRVRAYGDGETYAAGWGAESGVESVMTAECRDAPEFGAASYEFEISEDASVGDAVGTVAATDPNTDDTVTYSITAGNEAGKFDMGEETGEITVAETLDYETVSSYTLTVEASDGNEGTDTATVEIDVTNVAEDLPPSPEGLAVTLSDGTFTITWRALEGASRYDVQHRSEGSGDEWTSLDATEGTSTTYSPEAVPVCGTAREFRLRAYGDGETYAAGWGAESGVESVMTAERRDAPEFGAASYEFEISEDATVGDAVGTVTATDPNTDDTVTYSITAGNEAGKFDMGEEPGEITVAETLDYETVSSYTLTVEASDGNEGIAAARVGVALILTKCSNGTVVPDPAENTELVRDCSMLLSAKDVLKGDGSLNWSASRRIDVWQGVTVEIDPVQHVRTVMLTDLGLTGSIPASIGGLEDLRRLDLDDNALTGEIPPELGSMAELRLLYLQDNRLTGGIPAELANLGNLGTLYLSGNMLTGGIPVELGSLGNLTQLILDGNTLGGEIPAELGDLAHLEHLFLRHVGLEGGIPPELEGLTNLAYLYLEGNSFTGCIPPGLRNVDDNDLDLLEITYCASETQ